MCMCVCVYVCVWVGRGGYYNDSGEGGVCHQQRLEDSVLEYIHVPCMQHSHALTQAHNAYCDSFGRSVGRSPVCSSATVAGLDVIAQGIRRTAAAQSNNDSMAVGGTSSASSTGTGMGTGQKEILLRSHIARETETLLAAGRAAARRALGGWTVAGGRRGEVDAALLQRKEEVQLCSCAVVQL